MLNSYLEKPKGISFESQQEGETLHFLLRKHPITTLGEFFKSIFMIILPAIVIYILDMLNINTFKYIDPSIQAILLTLWYLLTMFYIFESFLTWYFNVYIITDKRLIDVDFKGLWTKRVSETALSQIEDATYETNRFFHILFDYGNISVQTAAEKSEFEFESIPKPGLVHDKFTDLVENYKKKYGTN
jgi:hypothetical protein